MYVCCHGQSFIVFIVVSKESLTSSNNATTISDMFKEPMVISVAYSKLFKHLCIILKGCDISALKVALINQAHTPDGVILEKSFKDEIKAAKSINDLLLAFDDSSYCNWLDIRLLEVLANCSLPNAVEVIDAYKQYLFSKNLKEVLPKHKQSKQRRAFIAKVSTKLKMDPDKVTVGDFINLRSEIEKVVLDLGKQILNIVDFKKGCLEINYTMPAQCSFDVYKMALHNHHKFYTIDLVYIEVGEFPLVFDPWLSDFGQSKMPTIQFQYRGKSL